MTGDTLKSILTSLDETLAGAARKLEMTPQNLDGILRTKDIKTGLIERLSKIYGRPISFFFDEKILPENHVPTAGSDEASRTTVFPASSDSALLAERVRSLEAILTEKENLLAEKDARIADLKDLIVQLRK